MTEKELQDYLYENPNVLFPGQTINEKSKEYYIRGKRIDLLFMVENTRYIVELKVVPITREHIGQIAEYYGLMKQYLNDTNLRMMLVSPSIPSWKSVFLEEMGIQCIEFDFSRPIDKPQLNERQIVKERKKIDSILSYIQELTQYSKYDKSIANKYDYPTRHDVSLVRTTMQEILPEVANIYEEFEPYPFGITRAGSTNGFFYEYIPGKFETDLYIPTKAWFAFSFGEKKNEIPNISVWFPPTGCDVTVNAELQPSQKIVIEKIGCQPSKFNKIIENHGNLQFKSYLKFEHQPRSYHWILMMSKPCHATEIVSLYNNVRGTYKQLREKWINHIKTKNTYLSEKQKYHLETHSKNINLALAFSDTILLNDDFWDKSFKEQNNIIIEKIIKLKPLLRFLLQ